MIPKVVLVANRGEIAIRVMRAAAEMSIRTVAVFSEDDAQSLHTRKSDEARPLRGRGIAPYLELEQILGIAKDTGCDAIHPGYGFLSENAGFARRCAEWGLTFGPRPEMLDLFGDKLQARSLAGRSAFRCCPARQVRRRSTSRAFLDTLGRGGAIVIKAVAGGGGRGMRVVSRIEEVEEAYKRCQSEARAAFGSGDVYAEQLMPRARHVEVQVIGDGSGDVSHLWECECSIQRRHQKLVEIAPSPGLASVLRDRLTAAALMLAQAVNYNNLGTFEFLVGGSDESEPTFAFIETNPRLQVEHTVTEEVTGVDLVKLQLRLAGGHSLAELGMRQADIPRRRGFAIQTRINMETMGFDGMAKPSGGMLTAFDPPSGPELRVDSFAYTGYTTSPAFDSLRAKLIAYSPSDDFAGLVRKSYRALCEFKIEGVATNTGFLQSLLRPPDFVAHRVYTRFVEDHIAELVAPPDSAHHRLFFEKAAAPRLAGVKLDASDPLAVLNLGKSGVGVSAKSKSPAEIAGPGRFAGPEGAFRVDAPMQGTIVSVDVGEAIPSAGASSCSSWKQ
jgi:pyruvate carboxylase